MSPTAVGPSGRAWEGAEPLTQGPLSSDGLAFLHCPSALPAGLCGGSTSRDLAELTQVGLESGILLPQSPELLRHRCVPLCRADCSLFYFIF